MLNDAFGTYGSCAPTSLAIPEPFTSPFMNDRPPNTAQRGVMSPDRPNSTPFTS